MSHPGGAGRTKRTRALYDKLLSAFSERPGNVTYAAAQAGVAWKCAKNAWEDGWRGISWARPLKARVQEEGDEAASVARVRREEREREQQARAAADDAQREVARRERVEAVAEELLVVKSARKGVQQVAATVLALSPAAAQLARIVSLAVFDESFPGGPGTKPVYVPKAKPDVSAKDAMRLLREWSTVMNRVALAADLVVTLGREVRGPDDVGAAPGQEDPAEVRAELDHLVGIYEGIRERDAAGEALAGGTTPPGTTTH